MRPRLVAVKRGHIAHIFTPFPPPSEPFQDQLGLGEPRRASWGDVWGPHDPWHGMLQTEQPAPDSDPPSPTGLPLTVPTPEMADLDQG